MEEAALQNMLCSGLETQQSNLQLRQWTSKRGRGASEQVDKDSGPHKEGL